ncbi:MAG: DUF4350 domain-containing protein, partial [Gemmatimonadaceae bacterium]
MPERSWGERVLRPKVVFSTLAAIIVLVLLIAPESDLGDGTPWLTTHSSQAYGALGFYRVVERLGWRVQRRTEWMRTTLDSNATYAILDPPTALTTNEVHNVLDAVRHGAGLFVVLNSRESVLSESLHVRVAQRFGAFGPTGSDSVAASDTVSGVHFDTLGHDRWLDGYLKRTAATSDSGVAFLRVQVRNVARPVVLGDALGRGRVVMIAEPDLVRNGILRSGDGAIPLVRALEWLAPRSRPVVFDEYHYGYGQHGSMLRTVRR